MLSQASHRRYLIFNTANIFTLIFIELEQHLLKGINYKNIGSIELITFIL